MLSEGDTLQIQRYKLTESKRMKKISHKQHHKKPRAATMISDKIDSETKGVTRDKGTFYNDKRVDSSRHTTALNIYAP